MSTPEGKATGNPIAVKSWNDKKQCWIGLIYQIWQKDDGTEYIVVLDVGRAETQVEIDDWASASLSTKPWEHELKKESE